MASPLRADGCNMADEGETRGGIMRESSEDDQESSDESIEDIYEVEKIVGISRTKGQVLYKVRWVSYGPEHDTWEPKSNLESCTDLIEQYEKECAEKKEKAEEKVQPASTFESHADLKAKAQRKKRASYYKYVGSSDEEADTLKDKFWRDLEEGKIDVFSRGDLYSKVKGSGRSSRPQSFKEMFSDRINVTPGLDSSNYKPKRRLSSEERYSEVKMRRKSSGFSDSDGGSVSRRDTRKRSAPRGRMSKTRKRSKTMESLSIDSPGEMSLSERQSGCEETPTPASSIPSPTASTTDTANFLSYSPAPYTPSVLTEPSPGPPKPSPLSVSHDFEIPGLDCKAEDTEPQTESCTMKDTWCDSLEPLGSDPCTPDAPHTIPPQITHTDGDMPNLTASTSSISTTASSSSCTTSMPAIIPTPAMKKGGPQISSTLPPQTAVSYENPQSEESYSSERTDNYYPYSDSYNHDLVLQTPPSISASSSSSVPSPAEKGGTSCQLQELLLHGAASNSSFLMNTPTTSGGSLTPCSAISGQDFSPQDHNEFFLGSHGNVAASHGNQAEKDMGPSCGDLEEMEFDLMDVDPTYWQDKIVERKPIPDYLELSNVELREAVYTNDYMRLSLALKAPCTYDLEQGDANGVTLIMLASVRGYNDIVELLALHGANVNATQKNGTTPLMMACELGLEITAMLLLQLGAHTASQTYCGDTALIKAIRRGQREIVTLLLDQGANFSCPHTHPELGPLVVAKSVNQTEIATLLYKHIDRVSREFERQVQITLNNCATLQGQLFPLQCFSLRESDRFRITFRHELQPTQTGMGMLLFIAHTRVGQAEVRCRFYGPCAVKSASLNGVKLKALTEESNFVLSFSPLHNGRNELDIYTASAPASKAKLLICAYRAAVV